MPIYAYKCTACGHAKDVLQKMSDALLTVCPACGQANFQKQLTAAGFQLKGSGWYVTDFRDGNTNAATTPGKSEGTGEDKGKAAGETAGQTTGEGASATPAAGPAPAAASSGPAASAASSPPTSASSAS